jgi:hypothetical protein
VTHEGKTFHMRGSVDAVVAFAARCRRQQGFAFVVADGLHMRLRRHSQFADLHCPPVRACPEPVTMGTTVAVAVMTAALGVFGTGSGWPDLAVAVMTHWR